jgi:hypothetical protein
MPYTPPGLRARLERQHGGRYGFSLYDPLDANDGITSLWPMDGLPVFVARPQSKVQAWVEKCRNEAARGRRVVAHLPASTGAPWFHDHVLPHATVYFLRGTPTPFPSCVVVWDKPK